MKVLLFAPHAWLLSTICRLFVHPISIVVCVVVLTHAAAEAKLTITDETITISGQLDNAVVDEVEALIRNSDQVVRHIAFRHCLGGQVGPAHRMVRLIIRYNLNTSAAMQVSSACAYAFLAGARRTLDPGADIVVFGLHNARNGDGTPTASPDNMPKLLRALTAGQFPADLHQVVDTAFAIDSGLVIIVRQPRGAKITQEFLDCPAGSAGHFDRCRRLQDYDLREIGVLR